MREEHEGKIKMGGEGGGEGSLRVSIDWMMEAR